MSFLVLLSRAYLQFLALGAVIGLLAVVLKSLWQWQRGHKPFPPGPPTTPLLGNLRELPTEKAFLKLDEWGKKYTAASNGLLGLRVGPSIKILVINKGRHMTDLIEAKASLYAGRSSIPLVDYLSKWVSPDLPATSVFAFSQYGDELRRARRAGIENLTRSGRVETMLPIQAAESTQALHELLELDERRARGGGGGHDSHHGPIERMSGAVIMAGVYGLRGRHAGPGTPLHNFSAIQRSLSKLADVAATPPAFVLPLIEALPGLPSPWRSWMAETRTFVRWWHRYWNDFHQAGIDVADRRRGSGGAEDSVMQRLKAKGFPREEILTFGATMISGGTETTSHTTINLLAAFAKFPHLQARAFAEVDALCGEDSMPDENVLGDLTYLKACFYEIVRWRPLAPLVPREARWDHEYDGFLIPAGTQVLVNIWAMSHDADVFERPHEFDPARYLPQFQKGGGGGGETKASPLPIYGFGSGLRVCLGQKMAENGVVLAVAKILWAFDVSPAHGADIDMDVNTGFNDGFLLTPKENQLRFRLRSEGRREMLKREWQKADEWLARFE